MQDRSKKVAFKYRWVSHELDFLLGRLLTLAEAIIPEERLKASKDLIRNEVSNLQKRFYDSSFDEAENPEHFDLIPYTAKCKNGCDAEGLGMSCSDCPK